MHIKQLIIFLLHYCWIACRLCWSLSVSFHHILFETELQKKKSELVTVQGKQTETYDL